MSPNTDRKNSLQALFTKNNTVLEDILLWSEKESKDKNNTSSQDQPIKLTSPTNEQTEIKYHRKTLQGHKGFQTLAALTLARS
jgi:hypothetical protein